MYLRFTSSPEPIFDPREDVDNTISMFTGGRASWPSGLSEMMDRIAKRLEDVKKSGRTADELP